MAGPARKSGEQGFASLSFLDPLGFHRFAQDDVKPTLEKAARGVLETADDILKVLAPAARSPYAKRAGGILRNRLAELARAGDRAEASLARARRTFDGMPAAENHEFIRRIEAGQPQQTPALDAIAGVLRKLLDDRRAEVQGLGTGKLQNFYTDYFPHIWKDPKKAGSVFSAFFGRRPLEGGKGFLKQRSYPTFEDGLKAGLEPVSDNPVDLALMKTREMDRYTMAHRTLDDWKAAGLAKFVRTGAKAPAGAARIADPIGAVWGKSADGEMVLRGNYYAPEGAARLLNNYLSPGLRRYGVYRALMGANNVLNQFQLGLSGFHAGFTSAETMVSKGALAIEQAMRGKFAAAAKSAAAIPVAPVKTFLEGSKVLREWYRPGSEGAPVAAIVDALEKGGGRARMDAMYGTDIARNMMQAFRRGNLLGGMLRAPFAATEAISNLIMKELVPRQKLGVFADLARLEMERLGPGATVEETQAAMARAWDSVENRLGEMTYDNLFWNRTAKDLAMLTTRSVGWNLGTIREVGGAALGAARAPFDLARGRDINPHRLAYVASLALTGAAMGAIYQYLATGKGPEELKDYYFPRTGETDEAGRPQRVSLPLYVKDIYHYATAPGKTIAGKASPIVSLMAEMIRNEDFYGTQIRNADDPLVKQMLDSATHVAKAAEPMTFRNLERERELGASAGQKAQQFAGITPAPADLEEGPGERLAHQIAGQDEKPRTTEEAERSHMRQQLTRSLRLHKGVPAAITEARRSGKLSARDISLALRNAHETPLARAFNSLGINDALRVYAAADASEKPQVKALLLKKARAALRNAPPAGRVELARRVRDVLR